MSVRLLGLSDRRTRRTADSGADRSGYDGTGNGTGGGLLLDRLTTAGDGEGRDSEDERGNCAIHGETLSKTGCKRHQGCTVPPRASKSRAPSLQRTGQHRQGATISINEDETRLCHACVRQYSICTRHLIRLSDGGSG